jgi:hypothetical protein
MDEWFGEEDKDEGDDGARSEKSGDKASSLGFRMTFCTDIEHEVNFEGNDDHQSSDADNWR